jgi:hypothetical protein
MLNKPTQQLNDLTNHLRDAAAAAKNGNIPQLVQMKLQQNPQLAERYRMLMQQFPNQSPQQVWAALAQKYGIDISSLM